MLKQGQTKSNAVAYRPKQLGENPLCRRNHFLTPMITAEANGADCPPKLVCKISKGLCGVTLFFCYKYL